MSQAVAAAASAAKTGIVPWSSGTGEGFDTESKEWKRKG